jgi:hypothetical protein
MAIENEGMDRREFLRKAAIAGGVAWAAPIIQTVAAGPAYATHSPGECAHSEHTGPVPTGVCLDCMSTCTATCGTGTGCGGPSGLCDPNAVCTLPDNTCPCDRCDPCCYCCVNDRPVFICGTSNTCASLGGTANPACGQCTPVC